MKKPVFQSRHLIWIFAAVFIIFATEFFLGFNWDPDHLMNQNLFDVSRRHYRVVIPGHLLQEQIPVNFHVLTGITLVLLGLFQLNDRFRIKHRRLHRILGFIYMSIGFVAVSLGLWLSQKAIGGLLTQSAFYIIAILWYLSAYLSVTYALNGELKLHRRWTLRNYFATLATGFMRPMLFIVDLAFPNQSPEVLFPISCWGCLVTALLLSQWLIERNDLPIKPQG